MSGYKMNACLIFDTETTHLVNRKADASHPSQPRVVQLAAGLFDLRSGQCIGSVSSIIKPDGFEIAPPIKPNGLTIEECKAQRIPLNAADIHGITQERAMDEGVDGGDVFNLFNSMASLSDFGVAHNADFDVLALEVEYNRRALDNHLPEKRLCTMRSTTTLCKLEPFRYGSFKWPTLQELHTHLFGEGFEGAHDALTDVLAAASCFFELRRVGHSEWSYV